MSITQEVHDYVKKACEDEKNKYGMAPYHHHFLSVVNYAKRLAKEREADEEIVEIAAWLHDIGSIEDDIGEHHLTGPLIAQRLLKDKGYPQERIDAVKHCIRAHRGSQDIPRETIEAECVADADAMSHFDNITSLFRLAMVTKEMDEEEARAFIVAKLQRSYKKLTPAAKEVIKPRYEAAMLLFDQ